ncbi:MAG: hypothetical protein OHK0029_04970 [Armatimonadaceae bacterium]
METNRTNTGTVPSAAAGSTTSGNTSMNTGGNVGSTDMTENTGTTVVVNQRGSSSPGATGMNQDQGKDKLASATEQVKEDAKNALAGTKDQAKELASQAKEQALNAVEQTKQKAGEMVEKTRGQVREQISTRKEDAAGTLTNVADALRQSSNTLRDAEGETSTKLGNFQEAAADQIERFSGYLRDKDLEDIVRDTNQFAHRQPTLFIGGAFLVGIFAARFFKSSERRSVENGAYSQDEREGSLMRAGNLDSGNLSTQAAENSAHNYVPGGIAGSGEQPTMESTSRIPVTSAS